MVNESNHPSSVAPGTALWMGWALSPIAYVLVNIAVFLNGNDQLSFFSVCLYAALAIPLAIGTGHFAYRFLFAKPLKPRRDRLNLSVIPFSVVVAFSILNGIPSGVVSDGESDHPMLPMWTYTGASKFGFPAHVLHFYEGDLVQLFGDRIIDLSRLIFNLWCLAASLFLVLVIEARWYSRKGTNLEAPP